MRPYYQDDAVTIYHADCCSIDEWRAADVLITDPPYGTEDHGVGADWRHAGYGRSQNRRMIEGDLNTNARDLILSRWGGSRPACVFGSPRRPDPPIAVADRLVWDKKRLGTNGGPWRYQHETIFVTAGFVRVSDASSSILTYWPDQSEHIHAKPLELMRHLVAAAPPGVITDPFCGSGSTLRAAKDLGRKVIGVEIDERYCEIAANRCAQEVLAL